MTFKEKLKSILHHSGHRKSLPNAAAPAASPTPAVAVAKPDPNKPPNARDPGFRKSFNLGDSPTTNGSAKTEAGDVCSKNSNSQNVAGNGNAGLHMHTLDKYGEDYLAVSPRTNVTVPEGPAVNQGLANCSPLDADANAAVTLGTIQEQKPKDTIVGAAKVLDGLPSPQQNPDFGREQFSHGERKDSGFVEPVPSRDTAVSPNQKPEHPSNFQLESIPKPVTLNHISPSASLPETKHTALLVLPNTVEDAASSVYSDDSTRPTLQQIASSDYGRLIESPELKASSPAPLGASATEHQRKYSSLVSEELPTVSDVQSQQNCALEGKEPLSSIDEKTDLLTAVRRSFGDSSAAGEISPAILPADETNAWSQDLIANIDKIQRGRETREQEKTTINGATNGVFNDAIPATASLGNSETSIDAQAAAFADIVIAHFDSVKARNQGAEDISAHSLPILLPANKKPIVTTTNTIPHADADNMGDDFPEVPSIEGKSPIVTTANTVPHVKIIPMGADDGINQSLRLSFDESIYTNREKVEYDSMVVGPGVKTPGEDSVYALTREIPGAF